MSRRNLWRDHATRRHVPGGDGAGLAGHADRSRRDRQHCEVIGFFAMMFSLILDESSTAWGRQLGVDALDARRAPVAERYRRAW
jgi:hypothetical protein